MIDRTTLPWISNFLDETDRIVDARFEHTGSVFLREVLRRQHAGGKRLRPLLVACCAGLGTSPSAAVPHLAAALELFHLASLFHDNILDASHVRRNRVVYHDTESSTVSILSGDYLMAEAMQMVVENTPPHVSKDVLFTISRMIHSEIETLRMRHRIDLPTRDYLRIVSHKTAALFATACRTGFRLTSDNHEDMGRLSHFGQDLGMAYQLTDDLEDLLGLIEGGDDDAGQGYFGLPLIELWQKAPAENQSRMQAWLKDLTSESRMALLTEMEHYSTLSSVRARILRHVHAAMQALAIFSQRDPKAVEAMSVLNDLCGAVGEKCDRIFREYQTLLRKDREEKILSYA